MRALIAILVTVVLTGCAGKTEYVRPTATGNVENSKTIAKPRSIVWNSVLPPLGKQFSVINKPDKSSGFMNLSYNGDPESFVDCGRIITSVKDARGERTYDFPGSRAQQSYEIMDAYRLLSIERKMSLEGRVNLIFEETSSNSTKITVNTRYVVTRQITVRSGANQLPASRTDTISFNSGGRAAFPPNTEGQSAECVPTGKMEQDLLSLIK